MTKCVFLIPVFLLAGVVVARGQETSTHLLSDAEKVHIIESVLNAELRNQNSLPDFAHIRKVSSDNIGEFRSGKISRTLTKSDLN